MPNPLVILGPDLGSLTVNKKNHRFLQRFVGLKMMEQREGSADGGRHHEDRTSGDAYDVRTLRDLAQTPGGVAVDLVGDFHPPAFHVSMVANNMAPKANGTQPPSKNLGRLAAKNPRSIDQNARHIAAASGVVIFQMRVATKNKVKVVTAMVPVTAIP